MSSKRPFRVRTITAFVTLRADDFLETEGNDDKLAKKLDKCNAMLRALEGSLSDAGYEVQTVRISTNPFGEWLIPKHDGDGPTVGERLGRLNGLLAARGIHFCSLGPSTSPGHTAKYCPAIVAASDRFCCSASVDAGDAAAARAAARCMREISTLGDAGGSAAHVAGGLGNFQFCAASRVETAPFIPGSRAPPGLGDSLGLAVGTENGAFARELLEDAGSIGRIKGVFDSKMRAQLAPIQDICLKFTDSADFSVEYLGIDTSLNPSLDEGGSVADAIECLDEVHGNFGGTGSLAAAAAITSSLQSIPGILTTGYSGLMLPVLEDRRLTELAASTSGPLTIQKLLGISSVCGVGIDTVPVPGDASEAALSSLILDVAALAGRWDKPLSCRVLLVPGSRAGEGTAFDSPWMCNGRIFDL